MTTSHNSSTNNSLAFPLFSERRHKLAAALIIVYWLLAVGVSIGAFLFTKRDYFLSFIIAVFCLSVSLRVFWLKWKEETSQAFLLVSSSLSIIVTTYLAELRPPLWDVFLLMSIAVFGAAFFHLCAIFPRPSLIVQKLPFSRYVGYLIAALVLFSSLLISLFFSVITSIPLWKIAGLFSFSLVLVGFFWLMSRISSMASSNEKEQARWILLGSLGSFAPGLLFLFGISNSSYLVISFIIFPAITGYALLNYRLTRTEFVFRKTISYGVLLVLIILIYALLTTGFTLMLGRAIGLENPIATGIILFFISIFILPLKTNLENTLNRVFFRGNRKYQDELKRFSDDIATAMSFLEIVNRARRILQGSLNPNILHIYIYDPLSDQYVATLNEQTDLTSDIQFPAKSPLVLYFHDNLSSFSIQDFEHLPSSLKAEKFKLQMLGCYFYVPLVTQNQLAGWMAIGGQNSVRAYDRTDIHFIESLCAQMSVAIERAQVVASMEDRVRQMNILTRIAQGINITVDLDDVLELIYAQTTQIIPADDFEILMLDEETIALSHIFYVEKNERLLGKENIPLRGSFLLEQEIIAQRKGMRIADYIRECEEREILTEKQGVHAWMGVPLNSGAETIGVLCLSKREPNIVFTQDQMNLLQAIADLVAGAIIKSRLLKESQTRTNQLVSLNELSRQLTSNLNVEKLLKHILDSAVDMLACEAGSLLMVDEETDELVFRVVNGPAAEFLLNKRIPMDSGIVGRAIKNRSPLIINNVKESPDWFSKIDEQTGFQTRSAFVIPLEIKEKIIGVLEVLNKKDGSGFRREDQQLLIAYASQAAVALENARMYTNTDRALEARIEELSMLQRIGRELNTSLDTGTAMKTTLEWAMRKSNANAGLVGVIVGDGIQIMASQGYEDELDPYQEKPMPLSVLSSISPLETGAPCIQKLNEHHPGIRKGVISQIIVPVRREATPIGIVVLESTAPPSSNTDILNFLVRLTDHAAIAISNAQLFSAVRRANMAKSEFVSYVSHELKNPMTSIKGYTELIAAGAVGPVNEAQLNFLKTIQSNVDRMATLVSDLADESRIEAGRLKLEFSSLNVKEVVEEVLRAMKRQIDDKKIQMEVFIDEKINPVYADRTRLIQILTNLVSNACKYTGENGKVTLTAQQSDNQWDAEGSPRVVHFSVADTGIGISEEDQKKIFQKFFRSEDPKIREVPGTGLGLNITKSLVELQGGKIWFESELRQGTTFHFTLPISES